MSEIIDVWVNCGSEEEATRIAEEAIQDRLAACANIYPAITSAWHWKGAVERDREVPLLMKTRTDLFDELARLVERLHSYETPSITGLPVARVNADYARWIVAETKGEPGAR